MCFSIVNSVIKHVKATLDRLLWRRRYEPIFAGRNELFASIFKIGRPCWCNAEVVIKEETKENEDIDNDFSCINRCFSVGNCDNQIAWND